MLPALVVLTLLVAFDVWIVAKGTGRNRTPDVLGRDVMPLRSLDWFDVIHPTGRAGRRAYR